MLDCEQIPTGDRRHVRSQISAIPNPRRHRIGQRRSRARNRARRRTWKKGLDLRAAFDARQNVARRAQDPRRRHQSCGRHGSAQALAARREMLKSAALDARLSSETIDVTLPLRDAPAEQGRIHPLSQVMDELTTIFADIGFAIAEGPDIETDDFNFTKLNFPEGHPAREMHDTFFFNPKEDGSRMLLRTHTSPVQVRTMLTQKPPIRIVCPGRTYRINSDATHTPQFHQVEGLVIDKGSHLGHLKWILHEFCKALLDVSTSTCGSGRRSFRSPSRRSKSTSSAAATRAEFVSAKARTGYDARLRHGAPQRAPRLRRGFRYLPGFRLGHGHRPHRDAEIRHP